MKKSIIKRRKVKKNLPSRMPSECPICGRMSYYVYYNAPSCEACKQFFRRAILSQMEENCYNMRCKTSQDPHCRACRLKRCLEAGMEPGLVRFERREMPGPNMEWQKLDQFIARLERRKNRLNQPSSVMMTSIIKFQEEPSNIIDQLINGLKLTERALHQHWLSSTPLPFAYTDRHPSLAALLQDGRNLLSGEFTPESAENSQCWDKAQFLEQIERDGIFNGHRLTHCAIKDWFMCVELTKTMPYFRRLELDDQISLVRHIVYPATFMFGAYYSYAMSARTVTRGDGFTVVSYLEAKQLRNDQNVRRYSMHTLSTLVEMMHEVLIEYDEFLLLLAILFADSTADSLSDSGRHLLYSQSTACSASLQRLVQAKYGAAAGAAKFAALLNLLNYAISSRFKQQQLITYLEVFLERRDPKCLFPKAIQFVVS